VQPLFGQLADIFGRRWLAVSIVAIFTIGSAICGAANGSGALIAGRAIQGVGSGGINMISDVIVSDLVPLRERGKFIAIILAVYSVGTTLGPFAGGILVEKTSWRYVFLISLPFGVVAIILFLLFLKVRSKRIPVKAGLSRIDYIGNGTIIISSISVLVALSYAESPYRWSSWRVILPLVLGLSGFIVFALFESSRFCKNPVIPPRLLSNATSIIIYFNTWINSALLYWVMFFLPLYFQAVLGSSPAMSGIQLFPLLLIAVPGAVIAVVLLSKYGRYRPLHQLGFAIASLGTGLFIHLDRNSSTAEWIIYQIITGIGSGMILNTLLPAFQAAHSEEDQALATASWAFIRSFGNIWGVAIPAAILNNRVRHLSSYVSDPTLRDALRHGKAYETGPNLRKTVVSEQLRIVIADIFADSLKEVWAVGTGFGVLAFILSLLEKEVALRTHLETEFGLQEEAQE
jgi:MFS family permease